MEFSSDFVFFLVSFSSSSSFSVPDQAQEILRLQALVDKQRAELDMREAEWRMRNLPPGGGDESGTNTTKSTLGPMAISEAGQVTEDLLSRTSTGGTGAGRPGLEMLVHETLSPQQQQADQSPEE